MRFPIYINGSSNINSNVIYKSNIKVQVGNNVFQPDKHEEEKQKNENSRAKCTKNE